MRHRTIYIRSRDFKNEVVISPIVKSYEGDVQTPQSFRDIQLYGERITKIKKVTFRNRAVCDISEAYPKCKIKEGDLAYIDTKPDNEKDYGENADYVVNSVLVGNAVTVVTLEIIQQE